MPFGLFQRKRKNAPPKEPVQENKQRNSMDELLSACEDYGNLAKNYSDTKREYSIVTEYLSDCETITGLSDEEIEPIRQAAEKVRSLNSTRDDYLNRTRKISDAQMILFDMHEERIPEAIRRLEEDEKYQDTVKRDMTYLEGEKLRWVVSRGELTDEMKKLKIVAAVAFAAFSLAVILMMVLYLGFDADIRYGFLVTAFAAVAAGFFVLIRYQNDVLNLKVAKKNADKAIALLNKVKIKYVNITNAVEFERESFHVKDSRDFLAQWEDYQEACRDREKFREANSELEFYSQKLLSMLTALRLYDSQIWLDIPGVLVNASDMVERKHELYVRRQKERERIGSYADAMEFQRKDIERLLGRHPEYRREVEEIMLTAERLIRA